MRIFYLLVFILFGLPAFSQKTGQELADSLQHALPLAKEDTGKVKLLISISQLYITINPKEGFKYADMGMELAQKLRWKRGIANLNNSLGLMTGDTGNNAGSRDYFEKSFAINQELDAKPFMIANMNNIGRSYQRETNFTKASEYYFKAMSIAEESGNDEQAALLGTNITSLYIIQKDYRKAATYAAFTIKKGEAANAPLQVAKAYELLGVLYLETKDTVAAKKSFEKALAIDEKLGNKMAIVGILSNLATAEPDLKKGIIVFLKIQQMLDEIAPSSLNSIMNLTNLGLNYYNVGASESGEERKMNFINAEAYFKRAESLCQSTNNPEYETDIQQGMADLEEAKGNYKAALQHYKNFVAMNDSIFSQENKNKIAALESQRSIDLKNREIENEELQIGNQQKKMWLLVSCIVFLVAIGALIYRQSLIRKKTNTTLLHLNDELNEANKIKAKFFGILSHDLRSPVANLINFLQLQKRKPGIMSEEKKAERESVISDSAKGLLETMEAILLWSKGQMEHFKPAISAIPVDSLFGHLKKFFADTQHVNITFFYEGNLTVQTDENYLQTIMHNLTANAIKALQQTTNAQIVWRAWQEPGNLYFSITDNGPGASGEQLKALYDETASSGAKYGLGLHIIRDLAKAIGCSVTLKTQNGMSTEFVLCLPAFDGGIAGSS